MVFGSRSLRRSRLSSEFECRRGRSAGKKCPKSEAIETSCDLLPVSWLLSGQCEPEAFSVRRQSGASTGAGHQSESSSDAGCQLYYCSPGGGMVGGFLV
jgi:hypothetical protein